MELPGCDTPLARRAAIWYAPGAKWNPIPLTIGTGAVF
jgi:hypothetical protein